MNRMRKIHKISAILLTGAAALTVVFPGGSASVSAARDSGGHVGENDKYIIFMEWGEMNFTYDYGRWNPNTFAYEADDASICPASGTVQGQPGWYGFDGSANRLFIRDSSLTEEGEGTVFTVETEMDIQGVTPFWYEDPGLSIPLEQTEGGNWRFELFNDKDSPSEEENQKELYLSLAGEPADGTDGTDGRFESENNPVKIGQITVIVQTKKEAEEGP